jgi:hypothetical protein
MDKFLWFGMIQEISRSKNEEIPLFFQAQRLVLSLPAPPVMASRQTTRINQPPLPSDHETLI